MLLPLFCLQNIEECRYSYEMPHVNALLASVLRAAYAFAHKNSPKSSPSREEDAQV
jgi:hypothetical protein